MISLAARWRGEVRRRQLLANLALTAAGAISARVADPPPAPPSSETSLGDLLITGMRDAMLGLAPGPSGISPGELRAGLAGALADFHHCRYSLLADRLPRLISAGHLLAADDDTAQTSVLTSQAAAIAARLDGAAVLRDHGGGFTPATVGLHRISAETHAGDPAAAAAAAAQIAPASLPTTERRARY